MAEAVETVVIGAGQAGLAISYFLTQQGRSHVVLEASAHVASAWRDGRWDSFTLVTPNSALRLPGFPYRGGDPDGFMPRAEVVRHLEQYAESFAAPVFFGKRVTAVDAISDTKRYSVLVADGCAYESANVIVATGSYQFPRPTAASMPPNLYQLHSGAYRNPDSLPTGAVLVVGSADSGCQIAEELHEAGRRVYLCVGRAGRRPRRYRGKDFVYWAEALGRLDQTVDQLPLPSARFAPSPHATGKNGGHTINLHHFALNGIVLLGRLNGVEDTKIGLEPDLGESLALSDEASEDFKRDVDAFVHANCLEAPDQEVDAIDRVRSDAGEDSTTVLDIRAAGITSVVWANGYRFDYGFLHLPVLDAAGFPIQNRGVARLPGIYFLGMNLLYKRKSGILLGVGEDAEHIASSIAERI